MLLSSSARMKYKNVFRTKANFPLFYDIDIFVGKGQRQMGTIIQQLMPTIWNVKQYSPSFNRNNFVDNEAIFQHGSVSDLKGNTVKTFFVSIQIYSQYVTRANHSEKCLLGPISNCLSAWRVVIYIDTPPPKFDIDAILYLLAQVRESIL